ncbi:MAG: GlcNAc-PI de-N-acetylase [Anaerolineaceae bacterium]|nr:MAG: GlcNAc-PI de-N-acetylase [Anaerolineaceae bacterium]
MADLKLLAVFAHPDDESMGMGGTLAKYSAQGVETHLVCASRGEGGWFGPEEQDPGPVRLGQIREAELRSAVKELGMTSLFFLDYIDGHVDEADPLEAIGRIVTHIRRIQPQVVVTFPHDGIYGHPDHIAIGQFTNAAIVCAADSSYKDVEGLPPHRVSKLYYMVDDEAFVDAVTPYIGEITFPVGSQMRGENAWKDWMVTTRIETTEYCRTAWRAIQCHKSKLPSLGALAELDENAAIELLAMQGTFYRAFSLVNGGRQVEGDLFEGFRTN